MKSTGKIVAAYVFAAVLASYGAAVMGYSAYNFVRQHNQMWAYLQALDAAQQQAFLAAQKAQEQGKAKAGEKDAKEGKAAK